MNLTTRTLAVFGFASALTSALALGGLPVQADPVAPPVVMLYQHDFTHGTYLIDQPGVYKLAENISFNPNSRSRLNTLCEQNPSELPPYFSCPADAYHSGHVLHTQYGSTTDPFVPGGPTDGRYNPAAFGLGFFAAIAISADDVELDLNGYAIEQSEEHALLQRFFSVVELANQPFIPAQGPSDFGSAFDPAMRVSIVNGAIGRSAHHGIHGNGNAEVIIRDVDFYDYEVAAVALNGVTDLQVTNVTARNRLDVPVLGTFSSAQFIKPYIEHLARSRSDVTLNGSSVYEVREQLKNAINRVYLDLIETRNVVQGRPQIDAALHPREYALFANTSGVVDGNSYSFVINPLGVAVNGFPVLPDEPATDIVFDNVHVLEQHAAINEVVALKTNGSPATDPVGAVFQTLNKSPDGQWLTVSSSGQYTGNVVSNAQALVAKAIASGEFDESPLSTIRNRITPEILDWVEGSSDSPYATGPDGYLCNGDSMFHVNKGVIGFKIDGAKNVMLRNTSVNNAANFGLTGSTRCGDYADDLSHPNATLPGYGGAHARAYSFAGSENVLVLKSRVHSLEAAAGSSIGFDVLTDSRDVQLSYSSVVDVRGGAELSSGYASPNLVPDAFGVKVSTDSFGVDVHTFCARKLVAPGVAQSVMDQSGTAAVQTCRSPVERRR